MFGKRGGIKPQPRRREPGQRTGSEDHHPQLDLVILKQARNEDIRIAYIDVVESIRNRKPSTEYYLKLVKSDIHGKDKVKYLLLITVSKGFANSKGALANPLSPTKDPLGRIDRGAIQNFYFVSSYFLS
ncbi:hypothetical protein QYE76_072039 [Lolium multiflorum]|uniref:Uncharacterized protein n=1 Tax=Lolium multiflorum TaxID=4521 RepID=A0AAD8PIB2_LOLMU|nr:hypothetical protein QYE76_072039 [Lolium multiflorum]